MKKAIKIQHVRSANPGYLQLNDEGQIPESDVGANPIVLARINRDLAAGETKGCCRFFRWELIEKEAACN